MSPASEHGGISSLNNTKDKRIKQKGGLELDKILALYGGNRATLNRALNAVMRIVRLNLNTKAAIKFHHRFHKLTF